MNLFIHEFKQYLKPLIIWLLSLLVIHSVASIEFGIFQSDTAIIDAMAQFEVFFQALGSASADITTPDGFLSLLSIYITLPLGIYSGLLGSGIISKEEKNKTAEFLFTLPVDRRTVLLHKVLIAILNSFLINVILLGAIALIYLRFSPEPEFYMFVLYTSISVFATQLMFLAIGAGLASVLRYYKQSGNVTIALLIFFFMLNMIIGFVEDLEVLRFISLYNYFQAPAMQDGSFEWINVLLGMLVISGGLTTLFYFYPKRDLYI